MCSHGKVLVVALGLLLTARTAASDSKQNPHEDLGLDDDCPAAVRGVGMTLHEVPGGVTIELNARDKSKVNDLQQLVGEAAAFIEYQTKMAALHSEKVLARDGTAIPALDITVKKVANGAQVTLRAEDAKQAPTLLAQAKSLKEFWDTSECTQGKGNAKPTPSSQKTTPVMTPGAPKTQRAST
jgi:hypothetical protein